MPNVDGDRDDVDDEREVNFLRHVAGGYDRGLGQLCSRCGAVLDTGEVPLGPGPSAQGFPPGSVVLVSEGGGFLAAEGALKSDRDRSDEADCESVL